MRHISTTFNFLYSLLRFLNYDVTVFAVVLLNRVIDF